jgi:hypothetical protein
LHDSRRADIPAPAWRGLVVPIDDPLQVAQRGDTAAHAGASGNDG